MGEKTPSNPFTEDGRSARQRVFDHLMFDPKQIGNILGFSGESDWLSRLITQIITDKHHIIPTAGVKRTRLFNPQDTAKILDHIRSMQAQEQKNIGDVLAIFPFLNDKEVLSFIDKFKPKKDPIEAPNPNQAINLFQTVELGMRIAAKAVSAMSQNRFEEFSPELLKFILDNKPSDVSTDLFKKMTQKQLVNVCSNAFLLALKKITQGNKENSIELGEDSSYVFRAIEKGKNNKENNKEIDPVDELWKAVLTRFGVDMSDPKTESQVNAFLNAPDESRTIMKKQREAIAEEMLTQAAIRTIKLITTKPLEEIGHIRTAIGQPPIRHTIRTLFGNVNDTNLRLRLIQKMHTLLLLSQNENPKVNQEILQTCRTALGKRTGTEILVLATSRIRVSVPDEKTSKKAA